MKSLKKVVTIILVLCMVLGSVATAFAYDGIFDFQNQKKKGNYVAFGDSVTRGYGSTRDWTKIYSMDNTTNKYCRNVEGSYSYLLAKYYLGYDPDNDITNKNERYWPIAQDAITSAELCDLFGIDDNYCDSDYLYSYNSGISRYSTLLEYFGNKDSFNMDGESRYGKNGSIVPIKELVENSSLITIDIGMGDVLNRSRSLAQNYMEGKDLSDVKVIAGVVATLVKEMYQGYERWEKDFQLILDYFNKYAKNAEVVIIGAFNPIFNMPINHDYLIPVGTAVSVITDKMNKQYEKWAKEYGYIFVDISNVETGSTEGQIGLVEFLTKISTTAQGKATHPTPYGYSQIANWIIDAIAEEKDFSLKTTIKLDTGRLNASELTSVKVDGVEKYHYVDKNGKLCIPCLTKLAKTLTITQKGVKDTKLTFYILDYDNGYKAKRLYTTNSVEAVKDSMGKMVDDIKGLISGN